ncbi:MAG: Nif3-like dinuclear metal center hexameric protein [Actinomycetota bacterium]|nr:Nif3-like dinuclear metal center hexameric protein [Actinomycetota bacterium]
MAARDEIVSFLDELLDSPGFPDYGPNGLQVPGAEQVELVVTGVSAQLELFERAAAAGAQLILCHHGIVWGSRPQAIGPQTKRRLQALFAADISLAAYHLPLDAHPEVGNNALICAALGLEPAERIGDHEGRPIGFVGRSAEGVGLAELRERCVRAFGGREPLIQGAGPEIVHNLGVISGAAADYLGDAVSLGLDGFLTGEPSEHSMADARENGMHFIAAGHYATETFGIRRLGELLAERFGVEHRFVNVPNPV